MSGLEKGRKGEVDVVGSGGVQGNVCKLGNERKVLEMI